MTPQNAALAERDKEIGRLRECLEPGKAPAIMEGLFKEAERLGFYKPTGEHALTQFVKEVEKLRSQFQAAIARAEHFETLFNNAVRENVERGLETEAAITRVEQAEKRIAAINGQRNVMAEAVCASDWSMFWDADKAIGDLVAGNCDKLLAQQVAQLLALEAHVGELRNELVRCEAALSREDLREEMKSLLSSIDATLASQPDLMLIEEVRDILTEIDRDDREYGDYTRTQKINQLLARLNPVRGVSGALR